MLPYETGESGHARSFRIPNNGIPKEVFFVMYNKFMMKKSNRNNENFSGRALLSILIALTAFFLLLNVS